jgi:ATP-dependent helicase HrpA
MREPGDGLVTHADRRSLEELGQRIRDRRARRLPVAREIERRAALSAAAAARYAARAASVPEIRYPEALPVVAHREEIQAALTRSPVLVVCGETGSGKTTQLPKMLLEQGYGIAGLIGHTQPRRIAARSVAARIAEELGVELGSAVGYKVRFADETGPRTLIRLMTDGILLAEIRDDPLLLRYDAILIDEAHERSLNIDFLLGYLRGLLPRRPELRLVVTSATIEPARYAAYFGGAPVIEVSGRGYPIETRYRPLVADADDAWDPGLAAGVSAALAELSAAPGDIGRGDALVFLPGEREIRELADALEQGDSGLEVLPLYSRLSWAEQSRVFRPAGRRRVVLATNVAETSLTVPGIRGVIDSGLARISRYSPRAKILRLPIERISRASAEQRRGRCGRIGPGLCIRLYSEDDYNERAEHTPPEVIRTNLASVILQMAVLGLGNPADFPFLDPPDTRRITDGYRLLMELEAVDAELIVTDIGRTLARFPVDPRVARVLYEARRLGALAEALTLAAALSIQDPRERPVDNRAAADACHAKRADRRSDFLALLRLYFDYSRERGQLSRTALRRWCAGEFLSAARMREWDDLRAQLEDVADELGWKIAAGPADPKALHRAVLAGFLGQIGARIDAGARDTQYQGPRGLKFRIAPGTPLKEAPPRFVVCASLIETRQVYARLVAQVEPGWVESAAHSMVKREYTEPEWDAHRGIVVARESVSLYGVVLATGRRVNYGRIAPAIAREIFVREALVHGNCTIDGEFRRTTAAAKSALAGEEAALRSTAVLIGESEEAALYLARLPDSVYSTAAFETWRRAGSGDAATALALSESELRRADAPAFDRALYPERLVLAGNALPVSYRFDPAAADDGATVLIPEPLVPHLTPGETAWGIPGWRSAKITELIRALPKPIRRLLVPAPDTGSRAASLLAQSPGGSFWEALAEVLGRLAGTPIAAAQLAALPRPAYLDLNLRVVDAADRILAEGRDAVALRRSLTGRAARPPAVPSDPWSRENVADWDFGALPESVSVTRQGVRLELYPALVDRGNRVAIVLLGSARDAEQASGQGVFRLVALALERELRALRAELTADRELVLLGGPAGPIPSLVRDIGERALRRAYLAPGEARPRERESFLASIQRGRAGLDSALARLLAVIRTTLDEYRRVAARLRELGPGLEPELASDVAAELARLVHPGFVASTPDPWLDELPRYLRSVARRLEKLRGMTPRTERAQREMVELWGQYAALAQDPADSARVQELRFLIEEYRVSLFAQELKTRIPVSRPRIERAFAALR